MAIQHEFCGAYDEKRNLVHTWSDEGLRIRKVGTDEVYDEAIDVEGIGYIYEETTEKVTRSYEEVGL